MPSRFDYVKYDDLALQQQAVAKLVAVNVESFINGLHSPRAKALAHTKLEECYMWIGKAIRDDQITRGAPAPLEEGRNNG